MDKPNESLEELRALNERYHRLLVSTMQAEVGNYPFLKKGFSDYRTALVIEAVVRVLVVSLMAMFVAVKTDFRWGMVVILYLLVELLEIVAKVNLARRAMYK